MGGASKTPSLDEALATPDTKFRHVRRLFATIADRYDLITQLLSFGRDRRWKARLMTLANVQPGWHVLDVACGTGDLALLARDRGASVVGLDVTRRMIELARRRPAASAVRWVVADMGSLPLVSGTFEVVTTGYGLRNVPDLARAIAETYRALRPGGLLCSLDFDRPDQWVVRVVYLGYLRIVGSVLGWLLHRDPDTYRYIPASIQRYPGARRVAVMMREAGFREVSHLPVLGGLMAIHLARK